MARKCSICTNERRSEIDEAVVEGTGSYRRISTDFGVSETSLRRHAQNHIAKALVETEQAKQIAQGDSLFEKISGYEAEVQTIFAESKKTKNYNIALMAIDKATKLVEMYAKLKGMLKDSEVNVNVNVANISGEITVYLQSKYPKVYRQLMDHLQEVYSADRA